MSKFQQSHKALASFPQNVAIQFNCKSLRLDEKSRIRGYVVTSANVHDSNVFEGLLDPSNNSKDVWADSAYRSQQALDALEKKGYREHLQRKGSRNRKLTKWELQGNRTRSKIRSRVEHIFGVQAQRASNVILRSIGIIRSGTKIGLRNLVYNLDRYGTLRYVNG